MYDVEVASRTEIPDCDVCVLIDENVSGDGLNIRDGIYNAPTHKASPITRGRWANLCEFHFKQHGLDTSVTERRVLVDSGAAT